MQRQVQHKAQQRAVQGGSVARHAFPLPARPVARGPASQSHRRVVSPQEEWALRTVACKTAVVDKQDTAVVAEASKAPEEEAAALKVGYDHSIVLQAFGWDSCEKGGWYKQLIPKIPDIKALGVTHLWLPPPSQSVSPQGYMPGQLYNLNTKYGNKEELVELTKALKEAGIKPMADIVINHRCADEQIDGVWNKYRDDVTHDGRKIDWGQWAITSSDPHFNGTGNPDTGDDYGPAPDLDHLNPDLRAALKDWLLWLQQDIGFEGWRLDYVKGYGAEFIKEYVDHTTTADELNIGEFWTDLHWEGSNLGGNQDAARQRLVDWVNGNGKRCTAFDFPLKGILQEAVKNTEYWRLKDGNGKATGLIGWLPSRAVTFVDNHDTGSTQQHWPFPAEHVVQGYAYILTHPGMPCLFWDHVMTWGDDVRKAIAELVELRKRHDICSRSKLEILTAEHDIYVARIADKVVVKMGPRCDMGGLLPSAEQGWKQTLSGNNWAVWEKSE